MPVGKITGPPDWPRHSIKMMKSKFTDNRGKIFTVSEVKMTPAGLTVFYTNQDTGQNYSCLLEAFSERFKEIQND